MHEISLAGGILRMVEEAAAREHFWRVSQLRLEIGALAGVEAQALRFALTAMMPGTCLEGGRSPSTRFPARPGACTAPPAWRLKAILNPARDAAASPCRPREAPSYAWSTSWCSTIEL